MVKIALTKWKKILWDFLILIAFPVVIGAFGVWMGYYQELPLLPESRWVYGILWVSLASFIVGLFKLLIIVDDVWARWWMIGAFLASLAAGSSFFHDLSYGLSFGNVLVIFAAFFAAAGHFCWVSNGSLVGVGKKYYGSILVTFLLLWLVDSVVRAGSISDNFLNSVITKLRDCSLPGNQNNYSGECIEKQFGLLLGDMRTSVWIAFQLGSAVVVIFVFQLVEWFSQIMSLDRIQNGKSYSKVSSSQNEMSPKESQGD